MIANKKVALDIQRRKVNVGGASKNAQNCKHSKWRIESKKLRDAIRAIRGEKREKGKRTGTRWKRARTGTLKKKSCDLISALFG